MDGFLALLERLSLDDLTRLSLPAPEPEREHARDRALDAAADAGRKDLAESARRRAAQLVLGAFASHNLEPTWAGLQWGRSLGTTRDRVHLVSAVEDAALSVVVAEIVPAEDTTLLAQSFESVSALRTAYPDLSLPHAVTALRGPRMAMFAALVAIASATAVYIGYPAGWLGIPSP